MQALYAQIPNINCQGLCHQSCTIIPAAKIEIKRVRDACKGNVFHPIRFMRAMKEDPETPKLPSCKALIDKKCSIYSMRPAICRLYGVAEGLKCDFGCSPERFLSKIEAHSLIRQIEAL